MKLVEVDKMPEKLLYAELINEFVESGMKVARIDGLVGKNKRNVKTAIANTIERQKINGVKVYVRENELYLVKA